MRVLVLGANGMIGSTVMRVLSEKSDWNVFGTIRDRATKELFSNEIRKNLIDGIDVEKTDLLEKALNKIKPNVVINCAGMTKHKPNADEPLASIPINTLMPHYLANLCKFIDARLIHVSTDCVFSGEKGGYVESDFADARDVYGKSKSLGEVFQSNTITLRTSTIGHELQTKYGLLDWFLSQEDTCKGYTRAIFSGLPTVVFAEIIRDVVIPHNELNGLYHVSAEAINKYELLKLIAEIYGKDIRIEPSEDLVIDRSLNSDKFKLATGYSSPDWRSLIKSMHSYH